MGTQWEPNGDPKTEKGPHGDLGLQMGTHVGAKGVSWSDKTMKPPVNRSQMLNA